MLRCKGGIKSKIPITGIPKVKMIKLKKYERIILDNKT
nr:MAG TPA: hypothetical protein [Caudoviricetes sp.]